MVMQLKRLKYYWNILNSALGTFYALPEKYPILLESYWYLLGTGRKRISQHVFVQIGHFL